MAEQWPFKPLVEGSSPSTLTGKSVVWRAFLLLILNYISFFEMSEC